MKLQLGLRPMAKKTSPGRVIVLIATLTTTVLSTASYAGTETVLHSFAGGSDGGYVQSNLIADESGDDLFGTTYFGGGGMCNKTKGCGTVFTVHADGTEAVLYAFQNLKDGAHPAAGLISDQQGNLYGTTSGGGVGTCKCGTVFEVTPTGV